MILTEYYYGYFNRCASRDECINSWWKTSRNVPECINPSTGTSKWQCNLCCLSNNTGPCNNNDRPDELYQFHPETLLTGKVYSKTSFFETSLFIINCF